MKTRAPRKRRAVRDSRLVRIAGPDLPYDGTYHLLGRLDKIRRRVRAERADVLESHSSYLGAAAVVACGRAPPGEDGFWHADHVGTYVDPRAAGGRAGGCARVPRVALLAPFDATFVAGEAQARKLRRCGGPQRRARRPSGSTSEVFRPAARNRRRRRRLTGDADGARCSWASVGLRSRSAGTSCWTRSRGCSRATAPATLVLFGDGPERERLERRAPPACASRGSRPTVGSLAAALASADALVHGCPCETFGLGVSRGRRLRPARGRPGRRGRGGQRGPRVRRALPALDALACAAARAPLSRDRLELRALSWTRSSGPDRRPHFARVPAVYEELVREASS